MTKIFVYGSLKKDHWNHPYISGYSDSKFICNHNLMGYKLFTNGIPFMIKTAIPDDRVAGEIYEVGDKCIEQLDWLEGHPKWYRREQVSVHKDSIVESYVYYGYLSKDIKECEKREGVYVF